MQVQLSVFQLVLSHRNSATITFQFLANSIPPQGAIINQALTSYTYIVDPSQPPVTATSSSNTVNTAVVDASLSVIKNTDSLVQSTDGTITYTVVIQNNGNTTANTVTLTDLVPEGTALIPNSVTINSISIRCRSKRRNTNKLHCAVRNRHRHIPSYRSIYSKRESNF